jgi:hypothetical protein
MGGLVPLGYRVANRVLHIVVDHAGIVRSRGHGLKRLERSATQYCS